MVKDLQWLYCEIQLLKHQAAILGDVVLDMIAGENPNKGLASPSCPQPIQGTPEAPPQSSPRCPEEVPDL